MTGSRGGIVQAMDVVLFVGALAAIVAVGLAGRRCRLAWHDVQTALASESAAAFVARSQESYSRLVEDESGISAPRLGGTTVDDASIHKLADAVSAR